ncbi:hypothetical protein IQ62_25910 [Streptomyces scabiei]|uniref:hypothetical protein n=1 Tax=Streptomyces scabiei TaxID=1930 RepID=UPI0004E7075A|nr:hypothetical protein [Streptomyces scabiei]KFF98269.1 hypothetical protein IQ62_25910 [Streptomyces scabiei]
MPMDVYAAVGALVRAEIARTQIPPTATPGPGIVESADRAAPPSSPPSPAANRPAPLRRRARTPLALALRRLAAILG